MVLIYIFTPKYSLLFIKSFAVLLLRFLLFAFLSGFLTTTKTRIRDENYVTPRPKTRGPIDNLSTREIPVGIAYLDTTISRPIHWDPFMHIYFRKIYKFIKTVHKSSRYNSLIYKILQVKSSFFFTKRFLKATIRLSSHMRSRMRVSCLYITCT